MRDNSNTCVGTNLRFVSSALARSRSEEESLANALTDSGVLLSHAVTRQWL